MRKRSETIGTLGRAPARQGRPSSPPPPPDPRPSGPPPPERGALRRWVHGALFENIGLKFLSIVLAATVFLLVNDNKDREVTVHLGVLYALPADKVLVSERYDEVRVTLRGSWRRLRHFDARTLSRINVDLRTAPTGDIAFTPDMIQTPPGLTVVSISPRSMRVDFDRRAEKAVDVSPLIAGRPQHGYVVLDIKPVPATVKVRGAERLLAALPSVRTREISIEGRTDGVLVPTQIVAPEGIELVGSSQVSVELQIDQELVTRKFAELVVSARGDGVDPDRWSIEPRQVEVTLTGSLLAVEKAKRVMQPIVKLAAADRAGREAAVTVEGLPPGVGVRVSPERVKLTPVR